MFTAADMIHTYTRADALADGTLVDTTATAKEAGIKFPVALTRAVWAAYVAVPAKVVAQDEAGRLWDVLWMLRNAVARTAGSEVRFTVYVRNDNRRPKPVTLKAVCHGGDSAEPVITVMLPNED